METNRTISNIGAKMLTPEELKAAEFKSCPRRNQVHEGSPFARCEEIIARLGGRYGVSFDVCKICQANGGPDIETNPFLQGFACHLVFDQTVAGPKATKAKQPTDAELEKALDVIVEYRGKDVAAGFVEALVYHESVTPEKGAALIDQYALAQVKK